MKNKRKIESEIDFKSLIKNPIRLFGLVYIYFFVIALAIGIYFVNSLDEIEFNTVPGTSLDTLNIVREIEPKVGGIKPAMDLSIVVNPTADLVEIGKTKYVAACGSCHGNEGKGDGVAAVALDPKPRDFHSTTGWKNGRTFYDIYKSINDGIPGTGMMAYEFLSPEDRVAIIHYIMTMANFPKVTSVDNDKLDETYKLSAGIVDPYHIPIQKSITLLIDENQNNIYMSIAISEIIKNDKVNSANLLKENVLDIEKVVYTYITKLNKSSYNNFIKKLNSDPVALGFRASVVNLMDKDLKTIYSYLKKISG
ncbi:MAG: cytochrome c [Melioribacteraceae bacterium]|nr:cytochrome c [Melioribacteraceae bacterium]